MSSERTNPGLPHWHCTNCHHEWDGLLGACGWCGAMGKVIGRYNWDMTDIIRAMVEETNDAQS